ncbi:gasdermin-A [Amblyraja radiata]|uniref:gasdermin-A n=1 Tax=Amblyraja radiata TaxID=386614 RepID=UPI001404129A|nr:gasdermin-A [Amblyraja radiata]
MFKKAMEQLISQIDCGGELTPATSAYDSERFKPLCLVHRRRGGPFWRKARYRGTDFKLKQILADGSNLPTVQQTDMSFQFSKSFERPIKGMAKLSIDPLVGNVAITNKVSKTIQLEGTKQVYIRVSDLAECLENSKVSRSWELIERNYSGDLCIVTEVLLSVQPLTLKKVHQSGSEFYVTIPSNSLVGELATVGAEYDLSTDSTLCIPEGSVLAYKVWDLSLTKEDVLCLSKPKWRNQAKSLFCQDTANVNGDEVFEICCELQCLDKGLKQRLLGLVCQIIEDSELLSILSDVLCEACAGTDYTLSELEKLDKKRRECGENLLAIWSEDQLKNAVEDNLLKAVSILFAALEDLPPTTLPVLIQSLKMQILPQQLTLVTGILKDLDHSQVDQALKVETESFTEDAFGITAEMLTDVGLHLERDSVQKTREPSLHELSVALYCLNALSSN